MCLERADSVLSLREKDEDGLDVGRMRKARTSRGRVSQLRVCVRRVRR